MDSELQVHPIGTVPPRKPEFPPIALDKGRYILTEILGRGGTATVFRGYDTSLEQWRAVKVLCDQFAAFDSARARFESEAKMMAALEHPNVVRIYDVRPESRPYLVMELVEGGSLSHWQAKHGCMPPRLAVETVLQVCEAMSYAHARKVIHRDIKPYNILVGRSGLCKVSDFGIGRVGDHGTGSTKTGVVLGTVGFMAPEQRTGKRNVDERADVYSIAATLWALLVNDAPGDLFIADREPELLDGIPPALHEILLDATRHRPDERTRSVDELARRLLDAMNELPALPPDVPALATDFIVAMDPPTGEGAAEIKSLGAGTLEVEQPAASGGTILPIETSAEAEATYMTQLLESPTGGETHTRQLADAVRLGRFTEYFLELPRDPVVHVSAVLALAERVPVEERSDDVTLVLEKRADIDRALAKWNAPTRRTAVPLLFGMVAGAALLLATIFGSLVWLGLAGSSAVPSAGAAPAPQAVVVVESPTPSEAPTDAAGNTPEDVEQAKMGAPSAGPKRAPAPSSGARPAPSTPVAAPVTPEIADEEPGLDASTDDVEPVAGTAADGASEGDTDPLADALDAAPAPIAEPEPEPVVEAPPPAPRPGTDSAPEPAPAWHVVANTRSDQLSSSALKQVFTGRMARWPDGQHVVVVLPPPGSAAMAWVAEQVGMPESAMLRALKQRAFQGAIEQPIEVSSAKEARAVLRATPGAVSVLLTSGESELALLTP